MFCTTISVMSFRSRIRRRLLSWAPAMMLAGASRAENASAPRSGALTVYTFGDSVLDCARYNQFGVHPGQLIVRNDDALFPEFRRRDLESRGPARLEHRAVDG